MICRKGAALHCCIVRFAMRQSGYLVLAFALVGARAADATTPVDYTQRNDQFAPGAAATTQKKDTPQTNDTVQNKRVEKTTVEKKNAPLADRRAPITLEEAREKSIREKDSRRPEKVEQPTSALNHKQAAISTGTDTTKPPMVAKYQESLAAATPWGPGAATGNTARFSATDAATTAKINRFVFRKNPDEKSAATEAAKVTPAGGGGVLQK
jgi:hypothetical protein